MSTDNTIGLVLSCEPDSPRLADYLRTVPVDLYIADENGLLSLSLDLLKEDIHELDALLLELSMTKESNGFLPWAIKIHGYKFSRLLYTERPLATEYTLIFKMLSRILPPRNRLRNVIALSTCNGWTLGDLFLGLHDDLSRSIQVDN